MSDPLKQTVGYWQRRCEMAEKHLADASATVIEECAKTLDAYGNTTMAADFAASLIRSLKEEK